MGLRNWIDRLTGRNQENSTWIDRLAEKGGSPAPPPNLPNKTARRPADGPYLSPETQAALEADTMPSGTPPAATSSADSGRITKKDWADIGVGALSGMAAAALQALLDEKQPPAKGGIASGFSGGIAKGGYGDASFGRPSISAEQRPSLALAMLQRGGYK